MSKRRVMSIEEIRNEQRGYFESLGENVDTLGICALVEVENMGFCKDGVTRWYTFTNENGEECIYFKH